MLPNFVYSPYFSLIAFGLITFKIWMKLTSGICKSTARLDGKTAVITGANSGIGLETAKDLAKRGARIIMVCRDMKKAARAMCEVIEHSKNTEVYLKHVDFSSLASVRKCAKEIASEELRIDILVNNAGVVSGSFTKTQDGLDKLMQINYFGPFLFTHILLGRMKASAPARIVNVSSETHRMSLLDIPKLEHSKTTSQTKAYANSKVCLLLMVNYFSKKLQETGVTINGVTPGVVYTDIMRDTSALVRVPWNLLVKFFGKNAEEGAQTIIYACIAPELANVSGEYFIDCKKQRASTEATDTILAKTVGQITEKAINLQPDEKHM